MLRIINFVCAIIAIASLGSSPSYATYYAMFAETDSVTVAIDSRRTVTSSSTTDYFDDKCKMLPLDAHTLFFAEGVVEYQSLPGNMPLSLDVFRQARQTFSRINSRSPEEITASLSADLQPLYQLLHDQQRNYLEARTDGQIVSIFVARARDESQIAVSRLTIRLIGGRVESAIRPVPVPGIVATGPWEAFEEFKSGTSLRSQIAQSALTRALAIDGTKSPADRNGVQGRALVETIPGWIGDRGSGGEVAIATVEASTGQFRWIHRSAACR